MTDPNVIIRPLGPLDKTQWHRLWTAYLTFYGTTVAEEVYETTFQRLLGQDEQDFHGLVAEVDGKLVGLVHYLFHRHCWRVENVCYLQDLFADRAVRGQGVGRKLIEAVYAQADAANAPAVYWLTQEDNATARQLYDRIGKASNFMKYQRPA